MKLILKCKYTHVLNIYSFTISGDFIPVEEEQTNKKSSRLIRDDGDDCSDEEERVDMSAITGIKEREERREKFYSAQQECMFPNFFTRSTIIIINWNSFMIFILLPFITIFPTYYANKYLIIFYLI